VPSCYLASRYSMHPLMRACRADLTAIGFSTSCRWINNEQAAAPGETQEAAQQRFAREDLEDIDRCDVLIAFTHEPRSVLTSGGRLVELGYALHAGKHVIVVGPAENIFCIGCETYPDWASCLIALRRRVEPVWQ
jgi:nucleoside 2-deoxyribosyltransferase